MAHYIISAEHANAGIVLLRFHDVLSLSGLLMTAMRMLITLDVGVRPSFCSLTAALEMAE